MVNDQGIGDGGQRAARSDRRAASRLMETAHGTGVCLLDDHCATDGDLGGRGRVRAATSTPAAAIAGTALLAFSATFCTCDGAACLPLRR